MPVSNGVFLCSKPVLTFLKIVIYIEPRRRLPTPLAIGSVRAVPAGLEVRGSLEAILSSRKPSLYVTHRRRDPPPSRLMRRIIVCEGQRGLRCVGLPIRKNDVRR